jgi:hypothetical protein
LKQREEEKEDKREKSSGGVRFRSGRKSRLGSFVFEESRQQHISKCGGRNQDPVCRLPLAVIRYPLQQFVTKIRIGRSP